MYGEKILRLTEWGRVLILPSEEIFASSAELVPPGEVSISKARITGEVYESSSA